ncbi:hypothetical protein VB713_20445 [Anabaena cylindrica UHCC 0172]|uniref:hypothetical protein n=1 Tax=Anabaena cylindrica TaxID=1165 RepID=UPI002B1E9356|nr:hypothetical protein [Anabaena cylindrica]MEA5553312.1 hypothetical protein [Anabaena cylindrica UHCC 0172]
MSQELLEKLAEVLNGLAEILEEVEEGADLSADYLLNQAFSNCQDVYDNHNI